MRPLGIQILAIAYRSGMAWNEFGFANEEFDALVAEALAVPDVEKRRALMEKIEHIMWDEGVTIQPYWRSITRHYREGVVGAEMQALYEIYPYKLGLSA